MLNTQNYDIALWRLLVIIATLVIQAFVSSPSKAKQPCAVPSKIDAELSHDSFAFRSNRTFVNSIENFPAMFGTIVLAILAGADRGLDLRHRPNSAVL